MATRLYLQSTGSAAFTPAAGDGGWEQDATGHAARRTSTAKWNSALTTLSSTFGTTSTSQTRFGTWVSPPLDVAQTITGTVSVVVGKCAETTTSGDAHLAYAVRVVDSAGTHRATLATVMATSTEFPLVAAAATRIHSGTAVSSFACNAGDRLVIEIGIHGVTPANETMQMRVGDPTGTADFALTSALTTDLDPWVELSQTITFGAPATASASGVGSTTVTRGAKRLATLAVAAGLAACSATIGKVPKVRTASASGVATATATIGTISSATARVYFPGDSLAGDTFARTGAATQTGSTGATISDVATGVVRDAHYITGQRGLLIEATRTQLVSQTSGANAFTGADWSNTGVTVTTGVADPRGGTEAVRVTLASGSQSMLRQGISYTNGQPHVGKVWARSATVGGASNFRITSNDQADWDTGTSTKFALTSTWQEFSSVITILDGTATNNWLMFGNTDVSGNPDATCAGDVEFAFPQEEIGTYASTTIPNSAFDTPVTRGKDQLDWATGSASAGTLFLRYIDLSDGSLVESSGAHASATKTLDGDTDGSRSYLAVKWSPGTKTLGFMQVLGTRIASSGTATTTATLTRITGRTVATSGQASTTATLSVKRSVTTAAAGQASTTVTRTVRRAVTASAAGIGSTTAGLHAKRLIATSAAGAGTATVSLTKAPIVRTASASGVTTAAVTASAKRLATASTASGTSTTTAGLHAKRLITTSAAGVGSASATLTRIANSGRTASAAGQATTTAGLHAKRLVATSAAGSATTAVTLNAKRRITTAVAGQATTSVTLAKVAASRTASAAGTSTASVTASRIRSASLSASGTSTTTATVVAIRSASASASGQGSASVTATVIQSRAITAAGVGTASATIGRTSLQLVLSDAAFTVEDGATAMTCDAGATTLTPDTGSAAMTGADPATLTTDDGATAMTPDDGATLLTSD